MRRSTIVIVLSLLVQGAAVPGSAARGAAAPVQPADGRIQKPDLARLARWVPGEILVQFRPGVGRAEARAVHAGRGARLLDRIQGFGGIDRVVLPADLPVGEALRRYAADPRVEAAEPNLLRPLLDHAPSPPADPRFGDLWGLENTGQSHAVSNSGVPSSGTAGADIRAPAAWAVPHSGLEPIVAVVDSGARITHEDLVGQLWVNPAPNGPNSMGCGNDLHGCNFGSGAAQNLADSAHPHGHGTHVAGTIAAAHNDKGVAGVCPQCRIMVLKFDGTLASELKAFDYARRNGAHIVNGSFGGPIWSRLERKAILRLHRAGILAVFAAGNDALDNDVASGGSEGQASPLFPASYTLPNILSVAATNHRDRYGYSTACARTIAVWRCAFTSFGAESVDLAAPGVDIVSSTRNSDTAYRAFDGTSMAAPHAAGVAGLVLSARPGLSHIRVKNAIMNGADRPASLRTARSFVFKGRSATGRFTRTGGRLNAFKALTASTGNATPRTDGNVDGARRLKRMARGRVAYPHDANDVYRKRLRKGRRFDVRLRVPKNKDYDLWVWKPGTTEVWQFEEPCLRDRPACKIAGASFRGPGKNERVRFRARKTGVYYFQVVAWYQHKGRYRLTIQRA